MSRSASPCPSPARRQVAAGLAWAVPVVVVGAAAPARANSPVCTPGTPPATFDAACAAQGPGPFLNSSAFSPPPDVCNGQDWTGDFTMIVTNPGPETYTLVPVGVSSQERESFPGTSVTAWTALPPTDYVVVSPCAPGWVVEAGAGASVIATGSVPGIPKQAGKIDEYDADGNMISSVQVMYRVDYWLEGPGLPDGGCLFSAELDWPFDCP